ncbi:uracil-DNA glycosylase [Brevibacillus ruminantium]|uniref:Uracil-DNA glycosylase n=1 Tax=Brevibacillus ruminantium TaxID=2950604 RepID=A0ABY4WDW9_9BACL|nr:uracil-DNA glycosylase [Brevibacillus ruminantium]USG65041.1 uracil-DNA glycosylase [Brevibacillus ruminantium]
MDEQCLAVWPEEKPPAGIENCMDCGLYQHGSRMIWGEGNPHAPIMIVLDNPGAREDREGNPFICGTRETLQKAAAAAGIKREELYLTYVLKRRPTRAYDKWTARAACMQHLLAQLQKHSPQFVFCLGNVASQAFFDNPEAEVKTLRQMWHFPRGCKTTVSYHPLAVRRRPNLWNTFMEDWMFLVSSYKKSGS